MSLLINPVLVISGSPRVGKTTLATQLAMKLGCPYASFGSHVRALASSVSADYALTRESLQDLGQRLVKENPSAFCAAVLSSAGITPDKPLVIDGLRHLEILPVLKTFLSSMELRLIFVEAPGETRIARWGEDISRADLGRVDSHPVEADLGQLRERADLIIDTRTGFGPAFHILIEWVDKEYPALRRVEKVGAQGS